VNISFFGVLKCYFVSLLYRESALGWRQNEWWWYLLEYWQLICCATCEAAEKSVKNRTSM